MSNTTFQIYFLYRGSKRRHEDKDKNVEEPQAKSLVAGVSAERITDPGREQGPVTSGNGPSYMCPSFYNN